MSQDSQPQALRALSIIKVYVMMPGASSSQDATYVSIKFSEKTTAEEVIAHIKKKKARPPNTPLIFMFAEISTATF